jgi:hypothetical protein
MRAHAFFLKRGHGFKGSGYRAFDEGVDAEASDGRTAHTEEQESISRSFEARAQQGAQDLGGVRPERAKPNLATLSQDPNEGRRSKIQGSYGQVGGFIGTSTGVIEEEEQRVIPLTLGTATVRRCEESVHLLSLEIRYRRRKSLTQRHSLDLGSQVNKFGNTPAYEVEQGVNRGETLVSCRQGTAAFLLQVGQEVTYNLGLDILYSDPSRGNAVTLGDESEQQADGISIALLRIEAQIAVGGHVFE